MVLVDHKVHILLEANFLLLVFLLAWLMVLSLGRLSISVYVSIL